MSWKLQVACCRRQMTIIDEKLLWTRNKKDSLESFYFTVDDRALTTYKLVNPVLGSRSDDAEEGDGLDLQLTAHLPAFHRPINDERVVYQLLPE